ncbi:MAG: histidine kinase [Lutimonas sp.]
MKNKFLHILLSPVFIALIISSLIIYFLPDYFSKYELKFEERVEMGRLERVYYEDLDNDGFSEKIFTLHNNVGEASIMIYGTNGDLFDQFHFEGKYSKLYPMLWFSDTDHDGFKEIYTLTHRDSSAIFNRLLPFAASSKQLSLFVDTLSHRNNKYDFQPYFFDINHEANPRNGIYFNINNGLSANPRSVYFFDNQEKRISKSPHLTNVSNLTQCFDLNGDGKLELLTRTYSNANQIDSLVNKRSDYHTWVNILTEDLNFYVEPIGFEIAFSTLYPYAFYDAQGSPKLFVLLNSGEQQKSPSKLILYDAYGNFIKERAVSNGSLKLLGMTDNKFFLIQDKLNGVILSFDEDLEEVSPSKKINKKTLIYQINIDREGSDEWLEIDMSNQKIWLYQDDFEDPATAPLPEGNSYSNFGMIHTREGNRQLYLQTGKSYSVFNYAKNPLYGLKYLIYLLIFLFVLGLVWLIQKAQRIRTEKQRKMERQIAEMQIKTIKNQVDPHFVFNAINTISEMTLMENKLEADDFICKFSDFMRDTLQHSDKITTTLKEELDFVENFIQFQRMRYQYRFNYEMDIDKKVDINTKVPKHVIFSYVENAIKHGLSGKKEGGLVKIKAYQKNRVLHLIIEDNGGGVQTHKRKDSTGNGLKIMEEIYSLYGKLFKQKISHTFKELKDEKDHPSGVRIEVKLTKT